MAQRAKSNYAGNRLRLGMCFGAAVVWAGASTAAESTLDQLRHRYAMEYLQPDAHLALAKYHRENGKPLLAFSIMEKARRARFGDQKFDASFKRVFIDKEPFDNSVAAEQALGEKLSADPNDFHTIYMLADLHVSRSEWTIAKSYINRNRELRPDDFHMVAMLAEILTREDNDEAAEHLIATYYDEHPRSIEALHARLWALVETDPAEARRVLDDAQTIHPEDSQLLVMRAAFALSDGDEAQAEELFDRAADGDPRSASVQMGVANYYYRVADKPDKALDFFLNAYFADPHIYVLGHAEKRIRWLAEPRSEKEFGRGRKLAELIKSDDPHVAWMAADAMARKWKRKYTSSLIAAMAHDDQTVRWAATEALMKHADERFDDELTTLFESTDLRQRGISAYLAVRLRGANGMATIVPWMSHEAEIVAFEAISALLEEGGPEGCALVLAHRATEKRPRVSALMKGLDCSRSLVDENAPAAR